ncbi:hypothetical protein HYW42_04410 [Candidatus Daviesbacteria bacterium]|nr:hypothetical protein [Candidatus Daviesbacteria bacterium]
MRKIKLAATVIIILILTVIFSIQYQSPVFAQSSCDPANIGTNQLVGCLYNWTSTSNYFATLDTDAPSSDIISSVNTSQVVFGHDWGISSASSTTGADTFSSRWKGNITFPPGTYKFYTNSDDGTRVYLGVGSTANILKNNGTTASWSDHAATLRFESNPVYIGTQTNQLVTLEFYENTTNASIIFGWDYSKADLYIPDLSAPGPYSRGGNYTFTATVTNGGQGVSPAVRGRFCIDNPSCSSNTSGRIGIDDILINNFSSGFSTTITSPTWTATTDSHTVTFCADVAGVVNETDETNNCRTTEFIVLQRCEPNTAGTNQLLGCMYSGTNFNALSITAPEGIILSPPASAVPDSALAISRDWEISPNLTGSLGTTDFSARWKGNFYFKAGTYHFRGGSDDGIRVYIDGVLKTGDLEEWINRSYSEHGLFSVTFDAPGYYLVTLEYYQGTGGAKVKLGWDKDQSTSSDPVSLSFCQSNERNEGLISAKSITDESIFGNLNQICVVDPEKAPFVPFKIPKYDDLKSIYFDQAKQPASFTKHESLTGDKNHNDISTAGSTSHLYHIKKTTPFSADGNLSIRGNFLGDQTGTQTRVVFVDGDLNIGPTPNNTFKHGDGQSGIVFVVKGDINIDKGMEEIDGVYISEGNICTSFNGISCDIVDIRVFTSQLIVNGSLISLNPAKPIQFRRNLIDNTEPGEKVITQVKYLVILKDIFSDTLQRWSEIPADVPIPGSLCGAARTSSDCRQRSIYGAGACEWKECNSGVVSACWPEGTSDLIACPLSATCTANSTFVGINQDVVWNIQASGGINTPYEYFWNEGAGLAAGNQTLTKRYTTTNDAVNVSIRVEQSGSSQYATNACPTVSVGCMKYVDSDGDTYGDEDGELQRIDCSTAGYVANNTDCDDSNNKIYQTLSTAARDEDRDGYTPAAVSNQCVGGTSAISGRTYYKDAAGAFTWLAAASTSIDCYDKNAIAHPYPSGSNPAYQTVRRGGAAVTAISTNPDSARNSGYSFDYNCNGKVDMNRSTRRTGTDYCEDTGNNVSYYKSCGDVNIGEAECGTTVSIACTSSTVCNTKCGPDGCYFTAYQGDNNNTQTVACY